MRSKIYVNQDGYRVLAEQFRNRESIPRIKNIIDLPISFCMSNTLNYLIINYQKIYPSDWVVVGINQIDFEIVSNEDFKKRFKVKDDRRRKS